MLQKYLFCPSFRALYWICSRFSFVDPCPALLKVFLKIRVVFYHPHASPIHTQLLVKGQTAQLNHKRIYCASSTKIICFMVIARIEAKPWWRWTQTKDQGLRGLRHLREQISFTPHSGSPIFCTTRSSHENQAPITEFTFPPKQTYLSFTHYPEFAQDFCNFSRHLTPFQIPCLCTCCLGGSLYYFRAEGQMPPALWNFPCGYSWLLSPFWTLSAFLPIDQIQGDP